MRFGLAEESMRVRRQAYEGSGFMRFAGRAGVGWLVIVRGTLGILTGMGKSICRTPDFFRAPSRNERSLRKGRLAVVGCFTDRVKSGEAKEE